jgi:hypothetical protein
MRAAARYFDDLVGAGEQGFFGPVKAERLGGLEVVDYIVRITLRRKASYPFQSFFLPTK